MSLSLPRGYPSTVCSLGGVTGSPSPSSPRLWALTRLPAGGRQRGAPNADYDQIGSVVYGTARAASRVIDDAALAEALRLRPGRHRSHGHYRRGARSQIAGVLPD